MKKAVAVTLAILAVWAVIIVLGRSKKPADGLPSIADLAASEPRSPGSGSGSARKAALREVELTIADWPNASKTVAHRMMEKYGVPDDVGRRALVWNDNGPWKRTLVHRDGARDVLEQVASYHVGNDRFDLIGRLPGAVSAERGRDELASRSDNEALNFISLNLADEVISGKRPLEDARAEYDRAVTLLVSGKASPYAQSLLFAEPVAGAPAENGRGKTGGRQ